MLDLLRNHSLPNSFTIYFCILAFSSVQVPRGLNMKMTTRERYMVYLTIAAVFSFVSLMMLAYPLSYSDPDWANFVPKREEESKTRRDSFYPRRRFMGECKKAYGRVTILILYTSKTLPVGTNARTMSCYARLSDYKLVRVNVDNNEDVNAVCGGHIMIRYKKYCAAAKFLQDSQEADWMLVVDDNTAVANPNHCIEEWIDDRVNIIFPELFQNWEISDENYLVRRSEWSINFLRELAAKEFYPIRGRSPYDKGILVVYLTQKLIDTGDIEFDQCMTYWSTKIGHDASLACGRLVLGYQRLWPKKVRIYKKAHSWIRDSALTSNFWCESDFLLRDWQEKSIERDLWMSPNDSEDPATCELKGTAWKWLPNKQINHTIIREDFRNFENMNRRNYPEAVEGFLKELEVWPCYPECEFD